MATGEEPRVVYVFVERARCRVINVMRGLRHRNLFVCIVPSLLHAVILYCCRYTIFPKVSAEKYVGLVSACYQPNHEETASSGVRACFRHNLLEVYSPVPPIVPQKVRITILL